MNKKPKSGATAGVISLAAMLAGSVATGVGQDGPTPSDIVPATVSFRLSKFPVGTSWIVTVSEDGRAVLVKALDAPTPDPQPDPTTIQGRVQKATDAIPEYAEKNLHLITVSSVYQANAKGLRDGTVSIADSVEAYEAIHSFVESSGHWDEWLAVVKAEMTALQESGKLITEAQWAAAYEQIATGSRGDENAAGGGPLFAFVIQQLSKLLDDPDEFLEKLQAIIRILKFIGIGG